MMHNGVENYRGTEIIWDISEIDGSGFWKGTAAIVIPPGPWSPPRVRDVPDIPERFNAEEEARESVLKLARQLVEGRSSPRVKLNRLSAHSDLTNGLGNSSASHSAEISMRGSICLVLIAAVFLLAVFYDYSSSARH
jgi:hypothetical protein